MISFVKTVDGYSLVFEKRSAHISQPGDICFPGGRFDYQLDLSTKDTAIRETYEELGINTNNIKNVKYWGTYIAPMPTLIDVYVGILDTDNVHNLPINKKEVEDLLIVPISYFIDTKPTMYKIDGWSSPYRIDKNNKKEYIFPTKDLNLPKRYHSNWKQQTRMVRFYPDLKYPLWGVTADIIYKFINKYKAKYDGLHYHDPTSF